MAAINAGLCEVALITHGESGYSRIAMPAPRWGDDSTNNQFELPYGTAGPGRPATASSPRATCTSTAPPASSSPRWRWRRASGRRSIPRRCCAIRSPSTTCSSSRLIAWPFHLLDCCLVTDAGGAVHRHLGRARARSAEAAGLRARHRRVRHAPDGQPDAVVQPLGRRRGRPASAPSRMSGVHARRHRRRRSSTTPSPSCRCWRSKRWASASPARAAPFVSGQRTAPGGDFPMNTNGGGLSYTHTGMYGIFTIIEAVRQLRGECGAAPGAGRHGRHLPRHRRRLERRRDDDRLDRTLGPAAGVSFTGRSPLGR